MGSGEDDSEDVGARSIQASSLASVLMVNIVLTPPQRPLRASLRASAAILEPQSARDQGPLKSILVGLFLRLVCSALTSTVSSL
jgi:hypothetical protein